MDTSTTSGRSPLIFFVLVFALTMPLWTLSTVVKAEGLPDNLPVTDIGATFVPLIAASILVYREEKFDGIKRLQSRAFDYKRIKQKIWYVPIVFLMPFLYVLTYLVMRLIGLPVPVQWHVPLHRSPSWHSSWPPQAKNWGIWGMLLIRCKSGGVP